MIFCVGPKDKKITYKDKRVYNVTSCSTDFCKELSPFLLGPVDLYDGYVSKKMENAWQYTKVYEKFTDNGEPTDSYFFWFYNGITKNSADRYPMGRGAKPLYSLWDGEKLDFVNARKKIYIPLYSKLARETSAFLRLKELYERGQDFCLWDYDCWSLDTRPMEKILNDSKISVGHGYILKWMLEGLI